MTDPEPIYDWIHLDDLNSLRLFAYEQSKKVARLRYALLNIEAECTKGRDNLAGSIHFIKSMADYALEETK